MAELAPYNAAVHIRSLLNEESNNKADLYGVVNEANAVQEELKIIKDLVKTLPMVNNDQFHSLSSEVRRMAYFAEDLVDTYVSKTKSSRWGFTTPARRTASKDLHGLLSEMEVLKVKLIDYKNERIEGNQRSCNSPGDHLPQGDEAYVVGIDEDVGKLVNSLIPNDKGKASLQDKDNSSDVIGIVGMGGSGKTTLARKIFNHPTTKKHFKHRAWIHLCRGLTTDDVLENVRKNCKNNNKPKFLGSTVKKGLVVLDNVWDYDYFLKDDLLIKKIMEDGLFDQTKIIITSRHQRKPLDSNLKWVIHEVQLLSSNHQLDLFKKVYQNNIETNEMMIRKTQGLPLAIVELAKFLKTKDTIEERNNVASQLANQQGPNDLFRPVYNTLVTSYNHLPHNLKSCFLYFALFSADLPIKAASLIRMWIAEGFVRRHETSEGDARELLQHLIDHTMVQLRKSSYNGKVKTLGIHNMMRDLCIKEAQEMGFLTVFSSDSDQTSQTHSRRAAVNFRKCSIVSLENPYVRSLFLHAPEEVSQSSNSGNPEPSLNLTRVFEKFKLLRILDIIEIKTDKGVMPKEIGNLIHLRYLRIKSTNIRKLPKTIGNCQRLLTLEYRNVVRVDHKGIKVPNVLWKLRDLRHLYLPYEMSSINYYFKLKTLKNLQTLWGVQGGDWMFKEMENLSSKLKKLSIQGIPNSKLLDLIIKYIVIKNDHLYSLALRWYEFELKTLEDLHPTPIKKLILSGMAPNISSNPLNFPFNLGKLVLYYTGIERSESMKGLGELKGLKFLKLATGSYVGKEWIVEGNEAFPQLEELELEKLENLVTLDVKTGSMPCLKMLEKKTCLNLRQIPERFTRLRSSSTMPRANCTAGGGYDLKILTRMASLFT